MTVVYQVDGCENAPKGVRGGRAGASARIARIDLTGAETTLPSVGSVELRPGEWVVGLDNGGGGYGRPAERDPEGVLEDVLEGWVSREQAEATYGVVFAGSPAGTRLTVDREATAARRRALAGGGR